MSIYIYLRGMDELDNQKILYHLSGILNKEDILINELMSKHTSFKIGGVVDFFLQPKTMEQIQELLLYFKEYEIPYYIIGNGSNVLFADKGFKGAIIQIYKNMNQISLQDNCVSAQAGVLLSTLANKLYQEGLTGFEFAAGIPGTLGGAVCMNAGAYGGEIKQVITSATTIDCEGNLRTLDKEELELDYRTSIIMKKKYIVVSADLCFEYGNKEEIKSIMDNLLKQRKQKQPLELPSAGSAFKRPTGHYAGKLIMDSGLRGFRIGDAQISEKHCGFIVNLGNAKAMDVIQLVKYVQNTVKEKFGVDLETEVKVIGEFK